jgi:hypothetical protein
MQEGLLQEALSVRHQANRNMWQHNMQLCNIQLWQLLATLFRLQARPGSELVMGTPGLQDVCLVVCSVPSFLPLFCLNLAPISVVNESPSKWSQCAWQVSVQLSNSVSINVFLHTCNGGHVTFPCGSLSLPLTSGHQDLHCCWAPSSVHEVCTRSVSNVASDAHSSTGWGRGCAAGGGVSIALWLPARKHSLVSTVQRNDERIKGLGAPETSNSVPHPSSTWTVGS